MYSLISIHSDATLTIWGDKVTCILCFSWTPCVSKMPLNFSSSCFYLPVAENNGLGYCVCFYVVFGKCWTNQSTAPNWPVLKWGCPESHCISELEKEFLSSEVHRDAFLCCKPLLKIRCIFCNDTVLKYYHVLFQITKKLALEAELPLPVFKTQIILSRCILLSRPLV